MVHIDLKAKYEALVAAGELRFDPHQLRAVEKLHSLQRELDGYEPPQPPGLLQKVKIVKVSITLTTPPTAMILQCY